MPDIDLTQQQKNAVYTKNRTVLVSAAAGSGKTRVLTERLLARISDDADIDSFVIITFTKAAAAELRGKIMQQISERLSTDPDNRHLRRQSALCGRAYIGTIHSFCARLLRENCHAAGISPDFRVMEDDRASQLKARVLERVLDKAYESGDESFLRLADSIGDGRSDRELTKLVLELHEKMQSHARPEIWAMERLRDFDPEAADFAETSWGREILGASRDTAEYWAGCMERLTALVPGDDRNADRHRAKLADTASVLRDFVRVSRGSWDETYSVMPLKLPDYRGTRAVCDAEINEHLRAMRDACRTEIARLAKSINAPSEKLLADIRGAEPVMRALIKLTTDFDRAYAAEKRRRAELDFNDLEHFTVRLLTDENGEPTPLAREISRRFTEIMVDEYQDVNDVQDKIFRAISKDGSNLFMVGDVKQSIYRFRLADPSIFTKKYSSYADLDDAGEKEPVRIMLQKNFRSRAEIINAANHVFGTCMSKSLGEIDYDENAELYCGADYVGSVPVPELMLIDTAADDEALERTAAEAQAVADRINELMREGITVSDRNVTRPLRFGDIVILHRSANQVKETFAAVLQNNGIPVLSGQGSSFFSSVEISTVICLLAVIDNPHQDVPLIAVLRSPAFGFTPDELSDIRAEDKSCDFFTALVKHAESDAGCAAFLDKLRLFREYAPDCEPGELLRRIYSELDLVAISSAMPDGEICTARLMQLLSIVGGFDGSSGRGLHRLCEWLNGLAASSEKNDYPGSTGTGNAVGIMTVHKSKGLEFPVVFLCGTARGFQKKDLSAKLLLHPELGFGPEHFDRKRGIRYPTAAKTAIKLRLERETLSEEMRLLYVALTRARERLIMTAAMKEPERKLQELMNGTEYPVSPERLLSSASCSDWLMQSVLSDTAGCISQRIVRPRVPDTGTDVTPPERAEADPAVTELIRQRLSYVYPHEAAGRLPSKVTATELKGFDMPDPEAQSLVSEVKHCFRTPELGAAERPLSGAEKGIATHTLLQYIDYSKAGSISGIREETERLTALGQLSERQAAAVELRKVAALFSSELGRRIMNADKLLREFKFSLLCPAEDFFDGGEGESVLLQGVIDCCIEENGELTVIDYKTDRVRGEKLTERAEHYRSQLHAYSVAVGRMTGKPVKECILYFIDAEKAVTVKPE